MRLCVCILVFVVAVLVAVLDDVALLAEFVVVVLVAGAEVSISHVVLVVAAVAVDATDEVASAGGGHRERILALLGGLRPLPNPMPTGLGFILVSTLATCQLLLSYSFWAFLFLSLSLSLRFFLSFFLFHTLYSSLLLQFVCAFQFLNELFQYFEALRGSASPLPGMVAPSCFYRN